MLEVIPTSHAEQRIPSCINRAIPKKYWSTLS